MPPHVVTEFSHSHQAEIDLVKNLNRTLHTNEWRGISFLKRKKKQFRNFSGAAAATAGGIPQILEHPPSCPDFFSKRGKVTTKWLSAVFIMGFSILSLYFDPIIINEAKR